jgi:type II secretory pathway pseudopilin PulG
LASRQICETRRGVGEIDIPLAISKDWTMVRGDRKHPHRTAGFTLIELVMIIVIVSVLGVVAVGRSQSTEITVSIEADHLARDIRHMQMLAMTWGQSLRLTAAGTSYNVSCITAGPAPCNVAPVVDPATAAAFNRSLESNVTVAGAALDIDALGRPLAGGALLNGDTTYTLTGGTETSTVTVARLTGFVTVVY